MLSPAKYMSTVSQRAFLGALVALFFAGGVGAQETTEYPAFDASGGDWGGVGLLQTRTARFAPDGNFEVAFSRVHPYSRLSLSWQILPRVEATLHFTDIADSPRGPEPGSSSYKDRGFDVKIKLRDESRYLPAIAVGLQDTLGTGIFGGEYLVASKRFYDLDFSLGIGWGYMANRRAFKNPFRLFSGSFRRRSANDPEGGRFNIGSWFSGDDVALFGGVEYYTPVRGMTLKLELDPNDYQNEPRGGSFSQSLPVNAGLRYRPFSWIDASLGLERGNRLMLRAALRTNLHRAGLEKFDPPPVEIRTRESVLAAEAVERAARTVTAMAQFDEPPIVSDHPPQVVSEGKTYQSEPKELAGEIAMADAMFDQLEEQGFGVDGLHLDGVRATVFLSPMRFRGSARNVGRAARVLANTLPEDIEEITVALMTRGVETARVTVLRSVLERVQANQGSAEEVWASAVVGPGGRGLPATAIPNEKRYPAYSWRLAPGYRQSVGGGDVFYAYQFRAELSATAVIMPGLRVSGSIAQNIVNNFDKFDLKSNSSLPKVRSDVRRYLDEGTTSLRRLELEYFFSPGTDVFTRVFGGYLEYMYGGVGAEVLYRPQTSRWAVGGNVMRVYQRDFDQKFGFRNYKTTTGHASIYYRSPFYGVVGSVHAGRYLARDWGATLVLSRRFESGVSVGAFATFTDVAYKDFGEGSFDKGIQINIPLDLFMTRSNRAGGTLGFRPLTRDGGQMVPAGSRLYGMTWEGQLGNLLEDWPAFLD